MNYQPLKTTLAGINLFRNLPESVRNGELYQALKVASQRMGQHDFTIKGSKQVYVIAQQDLQDEVNTYYSHYSIDEVKDVLKLGSTGKLGDNFSLSSKTVIGWFNTYSEHYRIELSKGIKQKDKPKELPQPEKTELSLEKRHQHFQDMKDLFLENGIVYAKTYDILFPLGNIPEIDKSSLTGLKTAKNRIIERKRKQLGAGGLNKYDYKALLDKLGNRESDEVLDEMKIMVLEEVFGG